MFYSQRIHDKCYRRPHFDAGQFVEEWDDEGARKGYCLYKMGCKGPTTYNACSTVRWNNGVSFPIQSGHGCIGCSEDGFWDKGPFYSRLSNINQFGIEANADKIGMTAAGVVGVGVAAHAAVTAIGRVSVKHDDKSDKTRRLKTAADHCRVSDADKATSLENAMSRPPSRQNPGFEETQP